MPDPETLDAGSDFSAFMSPGVSSALRRRALRQLWSTGDYNLRDGLNDYDQDFKAQLKPMAADMADKVRQWSKRVEDALEEPPADDAPDTHPIEEGHQATEEGKDATPGEIADSQGCRRQGSRPVMQVAIKANRLNPRHRCVEVCHQ
ncbi:DUF3306 domain-containing protein [Halomonas azerica]|uniref:DUF3306 domain-containing protein n=1 Tax=Vreelandella azerica TaxID=2732867 RepID=UPI001F3F9777